VRLRIVAIDTTGEFGSLALWEQTALLEEVTLHAPEGFSQILFEQLHRLLRRHGWDPASVNCWAATSGPGSFTGVRVGLAAVKGLAEALHAKVVAVSTLQALASYGQAPLRAVLMDARRGEVYGALYDAKLQLVGPEVVASFGQWLASVPNVPGVEFVTFDFTPFLPAVRGTAFEGVPVRLAPRALAGAVARIAAEKFRSGQASDPLSVDANYVRRADAELSWKD